MIYVYASTLVEYTSLGFGLATTSRSFEDHDAYTQPQWQFLLLQGILQVKSQEFYSNSRLMESGQYYDISSQLNINYISPLVLSLAQINPTGQL